MSDTPEDRNPIAARPPASPVPNTMALRPLRSPKAPSANSTQAWLTDMALVSSIKFGTPAYKSYGKWQGAWFDTKWYVSNEGAALINWRPGKTMPDHKWYHNGEEIRYAFGLYKDTYRGVRRVSHSGSYKGYFAEYTRFPDLRFSVVIFTNTNAIDPDPLAVKVTEIYLGQHFTGEQLSATAQNWQGVREEAVPTRTLSQLKLREYLGDFFSEELDVTAGLKIEKGKLVMKLVRTRDILEALQEDRFITTYANDDAYELMTRHIEFVRSDGGEVTGFAMHADPIRNLKFEKVN